MKVELNARQLLAAGHFEDAMNMVGSEESTALAEKYRTLKEEFHTGKIGGDQFRHELLALTRDAFIITSNFEPKQ